MALNFPEECGGIGPDAVTLAFPFTVGIEANVPQRCIPDPVDPDNLKRCYYVYIPEGVSGKVPLVVDTHGSASCPVFSTAYTGWAEMAAAEKFMVVYPMGNYDPALSEISCWGSPGGLPFGDDADDEKTTTSDCCCQEDDGVEFQPPEKTMDAEYISAVIDDIKADSGSPDVSVDPSRVYLTGHSNGCIVSMDVAGRYSDKVAAVACYGGSLVSPFVDDYNPTPIFWVHGLRDGELPYDGFTYDSFFFGNYFLPSVPQIFGYLADQNGCASEVAIDNVTLGEEGVIQSQSGCTNGANVTLVTLATAGHTPYLGAEQNLELNPGAVPTTVETTRMGWEFISQFRLAAPPTASPTDAPVPTAAPAPTDSPAPTISAPPTSSSGTKSLGTVLLVIVALLQLA